MIFCKRLIKIAALMCILALAYTGFAFGEVSSEEAAKLGTTLTGVGAEKAGNEDGTIPPYTGGLTTPPADYIPGSGVRPDPFAAERPLFSIDARNMAQYADKLTEGTKALMKKFPTFRIDVYKTHRTVAFPDYVIKNTAKNAVKATTTHGGLSVKDAHAGYPFPIPKDGYEVMWNHLVRYQGRAYESKELTFIVDVSGRLILTGGHIHRHEFPYYDEDPTRSDANIFWKFRWVYTRPPRKVGEVGQLYDPVNMYERGRIAYSYLPGQRRVKLAPQVAFDAPTTETSGNDTYDENWIFNGSMERYDMKLIGKKEMYVPYNNYRAVYIAKAEELYGPRHFNPDVIRWELHRVWVVEATLKPGKRHIYPKRVMYIDEDSWTAVAAELYDAHGNFFKINNVYVTQSYDMMAPNSLPYSHYNMTNGVYAFQYRPAGYGYIRKAKVRPEREWAPDTMAARGLR